MAITGYSFAEAPAIYGVLTAIFTGEGVLALSFAAMKPAYYSGSRASC